MSRSLSTYFDSSRSYAGQKSFDNIAKERESQARITATGLTTPTVRSLGARAPTYTSNVHTIRKAACIRDTNVPVSGKLEAQCNQITELLRITVDLRSDVQEYGPGVASFIPVEKATQHLRLVAGILNFQHEVDQYLFGGMSIKKAPIQDIYTFEETSNIGKNNTPNANYTSTAPSAQKTTTALGLKTSIEISPKDRAFVNLIAALHAMKNLDNDPSAQDLAIVFFDIAFEKFQQIGMRIGAKTDGVATSRRTLNTTAVAARRTIGTFETDAAQINAKYQQIEAAITSAAYEIGKIAQLPGVHTYL